VKIEREVVTIKGTTILKSCQRGNSGVSMAQFDRLVDREDIIFLADPNRDKIVSKTDGVTIFFIPPDHSGACDYPITNCISFCMPPWDYRELRDCNKKIYPLIKKSVFKSKFKKWGGSICCLLNNIDSACDGILQTFLWNVSTDVIHVFNMLEYADKRVKSYQWLVHRYPVMGGDGYADHETIIKFASDYVALKVAEVICTLKVDYKTLGNSRLLGHAFEAYVLKHALNVSQGRFLEVLVRKIDSGSVFVPAVKKHQFFSTQSKVVSYDDGTLYIPIEPNRRGIYFVMPPWVFQATISKDYSAEKLDWTLNQFPSVSEWNLCFIIPKIVDEFKAPSVSAYPTYTVSKKYKITIDF
jgi:hypothetical protein